MPKIQPLGGLKILDLTRVLAGPYASMLLADLGAEVIKVERPKSGDDTRSWPPFAKNTTESIYFLSINRNKRSLTANISSKRGIDVIKRLALQSDVLIENYIPGKLDRFGLGYNQLKLLNPKLVYCSITGYGPTGPYSTQPGYDISISADAGLMHITGEKAPSLPVRPGVALIDLTTGLYAHSAIMAALISRGITGEGEKIDVSLLECQVASLANVAHNYLINDLEAERWGTQHSSIVPYQMFECKDGHIVIGVGNDMQYVKLCNSLNAVPLMDPKFSTNALRVTNRKEIVAILEHIFMTGTKAYWKEIIGSIGIAFGPVNNLKETFCHEQVIHSSIVKEVHHPTAGYIKLVGPAVRYSKSSATIKTAPPLLGQHTDEILENLGYTEEEIAEMRLHGDI